MNVGLRPRLKARPSLYDLIHNRTIESLSLLQYHPVANELLSELPPLPPSPSPVQLHFPAQLRANKLGQVIESAQMAPKKAPARDEDGEEQYGGSHNDELAACS